MGSRTRLLRFEPGVYTTAPFVHDHWEEVYLLQGDLIVGNDAEGKGGERSPRQLTPAVRPGPTTGHSNRTVAACSSRSTTTMRARNKRNHTCLADQWMLSLAQA